MYEVNPTMPSLPFTKILALDFETYYDQEYSLRNPKISMSEYIRDPRFKAHGLGYHYLDAGESVGETTWVSHRDVVDFLAGVEWDHTAFLAHNTAFDGLILSHHYGHIPTYYLDTLSIARGLHDHSIGAGLDEVAEHYGLGGKVTGVLESVKGKRILTLDEEIHLASYCINDVDVMIRIFERMIEDYPDDELDLIHLTINAFCNPVLEVDHSLAREELISEVSRRETTLESVAELIIDGGIYEAIHEQLQDEKPYKTELGKEKGAALARKKRNAIPPLQRVQSLLSSNKTFPQIISYLGETVAEKQGKKGLIPAVSKNDLEFQRLQASDVPQVSEVCEARLIVKSTIGETRAARLIQHSLPRLPILLNYCKAHTTRWCVPGNHEILTPTGWIRLDQWDKEPVMQWNPDSGALTWEENPLKNSFPFSGKLVNLDGRYVKLACTPEHRLATYTSKGTFKPRIAHEAVGLNITVPVSGTVEQWQSTTDPAILRLQVAFQADGCFDRHRIVFKFRKIRKMERLREILGLLGIFWKEYKCKQETQFVFQYSGLFKQLPWAWINLPRIDIETILREVQYWDGQEKRYFNTDRQSAEVVATLAHLAGYRANIHTEDRSAIPKHADKYTVQWTKKTISHPQARHWGYINYSGAVYCPTVNTGYFLIRYKDTIHITGNSGGDKLNPQNFPAERKGNKARLRRAITAPKGYVIGVADSSQIEDRMNCWMAGQDDILQLYAEDGDAYGYTAEVIYGAPRGSITKATNKAKRDQGKVARLGLGYGCGVDKYRLINQVGAFGPPQPHFSHDDAERDVKKYRTANSNIVGFWYFLNDDILPLMMRGEEYEWIPPHADRTILRFHQRGVDLPNGLTLWYPDLRATPMGQSGYRDFNYKAGKHGGRAKIYGGLFCENLIQALARVVVGEQMLKIAERYRVVMMTHDEVIFLIPENEADEGLAWSLDIMSQPPVWAQTLPVAAEGGWDKVYSK